MPQMSKLHIEIQHIISELAAAEINMEMSNLTAVYLGGVIPYEQLLLAQYCVIRLTPNTGSDA